MLWKHTRERLGGSHCRHQVFYRTLTKFATTTTPTLPSSYKTLPRLYIPQLQPASLLSQTTTVSNHNASTISLSSSQSSRLERVLRLLPGTKLRVFFGHSSDTLKQTTTQSTISSEWLVELKQQGVSGSTGKGKEGALFGVINQMGPISRGRVVRNGAGAGGGVGRGVSLLQEIRRSSSPSSPSSSSSSSLWLSPPPWLLSAPLKSQTRENMVVEKACELGVGALLHIISANDQTHTFIPTPASTTTFTNNTPLLTEEATAHERTTNKRGKATQKKNTHSATDLEELINDTADIVDIRNTLGDSHATAAKQWKDKLHAFRVQFSEAVSAVVAVPLLPLPTPVPRQQQQQQEQEHKQKHSLLTAKACAWIVEACEQSERLHIPLLYTSSAITLPELLLAWCCCSYTPYPAVGKKSMDGGSSSSDRSLLNVTTLFPLLRLVLFRGQQSEKIITPTSVTTTTNTTELLLHKIESNFDLVIKRVSKVAMDTIFPILFRQHTVAAEGMTATEPDPPRANDVYVLFIADEDAADARQMMIPSHMLPASTTSTTSTSTSTTTSSFVDPTPPPSTIAQVINELAREYHQSNSSISTSRSSNSDNTPLATIATATSGPRLRIHPYLVVGPEGGWSDAEKQLIYEMETHLRNKEPKCGYIVTTSVVVRRVSLGKNVLRAETASIVGLGQLMQQ